MSGRRHLRHQFLTLDNVRVTIGNRYTANVVSYSDYYAFGMQLPGRHGAQSGSDLHRYGFNGMEKDDELKGEGNSYDFGARIYDPRVGRWLSRDPLAGKQPSQSPYKAFKNSPIIYNDPDGRDEYVRIVIKIEGQDPVIYVPKKNKVSTKVMTDGTSSASAHSNNYYDFETTYTIVIDKKGKTTMYKSYEYLYKNGLKDFDLAAGTVNEKGPYYNKNEADGFSWGVTLNLTGNGGTQKGGYVYTSKDGGASPTRQRSLNSAEERDIGGLLDMLGALKAGSMNSEKADDMKDYLDKLGTVKDITEDSEDPSIVKEQFKKKADAGDDPVVVKQTVEYNDQKAPMYTGPISRSEAESYYGEKKYNKTRDTLTISKPVR